MTTATAELEVTRHAGESIAVEGEEQKPLSIHDVFVRVGLLTRNLHDTLRELGYDKGVEAAVGSLPDARARLDYIANLTGKAAERVLGASERAKSLQSGTREALRVLDAKWAALLDASPAPGEVCELGRETRQYLARAERQFSSVDEELTDIMLAQDFHDLTGQVIQRITRLAQSLEEQLVKLLLDASPPAQRREVLESALAGPVINSEGRDDVVTDQGQVDDLLESLGF